MILVMNNLGDTLHTSILDKERISDGEIEHGPELNPKPKFYNKRIFVCHIWPRHFIFHWFSPLLGFCGPWYGLKKSVQGRLTNTIRFKSYCGFLLRSADDKWQMRSSSSTHSHYEQNFQFSPKNYDFRRRDCTGWYLSKWTIILFFKL